MFRFLIFATAALAALAALVVACFCCPHFIVEISAGLLFMGVGAVTEAQLITNKGGSTTLAGLPVAASTTIYEGSLVFNNSGGYADDDTSTGSNGFAGIATSTKDNSSGGNGDLKVDVHHEGVFLLTGSGFSQATVDAEIYASDNYTVTTTSSNNTKIGVCTEFVSATQIFVKLYAFNPA